MDRLRIALFMGLVAVTSASMACQKQDQRGPAEKAGAKVDQAAEKAENSAERASEKTGEAVEETGEKMQGKK